MSIVLIPLAYALYVLVPVTVTLTLFALVTPRKRH